MRYCKYCGKEIDDDIAVCPHCGKEIKRIENNTSSEQSTEGKAGIIERWPAVNSKVFMAIAACVVIVGLAMIVMGGRCRESGCSNKAAPGSKYCYSHKCVISDCKNRQMSFSSYCYTHYNEFDDNAKSGQNSYVASQLQISDIKLSSYGDYINASGSITNNSDYTVKFVKIKGSFESSSGAVIDTDWTYAVDSAGLAPGESCKWELHVKRDYQISNCNVSIIDFKTE